MIHERIVRNLDDDQRLDVEAILGDPVAIAARNERRRDALAIAGVELG